VPVDWTIGGLLSFGRAAKGVHEVMVKEGAFIMTTLEGYKRDRESREQRSGRRLSHVGERHEPERMEAIG
jgi:hypothetical protein